MSAVATQPDRSALVTDPPATVRPAPRLFEPEASGEVSLEESILGVWEDLTAGGRAGCPVCGGRIEPTGCLRCGSELS